MPNNNHSSLIDKAKHSTTYLNYIKEAYVHNDKTYKNGIAVLKIENNKYIKVPLITNWRYNYKKRNWTHQNKEQNLEETITFYIFLSKAKTI